MQRGVLDHGSDDRPHVDEQAGGHHEYECGPHAEHEDSGWRQRTEKRQRAPPGAVHRVHTGECFPRHRTLLLDLFGNGDVIVTLGLQEVACLGGVSINANLLFPRERTRREQALTVLLFGRLIVAEVSTRPCGVDQAVGDGVTHGAGRALAIAADHGSRREGIVHIAHPLVHHRPHDESPTHNGQGAACDHQRAQVHTGVPADLTET